MISPVSMFTWWYFASTTVERDDQAGLRKHLDPDHQHDEQLPDAEPVSAPSATAARNASTIEDRDGSR